MSINKNKINFYISDIDGMRALAVLGVIIFHFNKSILPGGYLGVDIFFTISGFLVGGAIFSSFNKKSFLWRSFVKRRFLRLFPALVFASLFIIISSYLIFLPSDFENALSATKYTISGLSNIYFWTQINYFNPSSLLNPLLHIWSLSLEEQFYIFFPILLYFGAFVRIKSILLIHFTFIVSLILAIWGGINEPNASFYLLPTRMWEFILGLYAFLIKEDFDKNIRKANPSYISLAQFMALSLIFSSFFIFDSNLYITSHISIFSLIGTCALLIFSSNKATIGFKLLNNKILRHIGILSYSLYLFHQPIISFILYRYDQFNTPLYIISSILIYALSWFSFYVIETYFRQYKSLAKIKLIILSLLALFLIALSFFSKDITKSHFLNDNKNYIYSEQIMQPNTGLSDICEFSLFFKENCMINKDAADKEDELSIAILGDSYAMHIFQMVRASNADADIYQFTGSQCAPVPNHAAISILYDYEKCINGLNHAIEFITKSQKITHVIVSSSTYLFDETPTYNLNGKIIQDENIFKKEIAKMLNTIKASGKEIVFVIPPLKANFNIGKCLKRSIVFNYDIQNCDYPIKESLLLLKIENFAKNNLDNKEIINLSDYLCNDNKCISSINNVPIYRDGGHFTKEGSRLLGEKLLIFKQ